MIGCWKIYLTFSWPHRLKNARLEGLYLKFQLFLFYFRVEQLFLEFFDAVWLLLNFFQWIFITLVISLQNVVYFFSFAWFEGVQIFHQSFHKPLVFSCLLFTLVCTFYRLPRLTFKFFNFTYLAFQALYFVFSSM